MEKHSALASKKLGVGVEQVSIFLTADNTVIAFFEHSADDIEEPILPRLRTEETILRRSSDASMLTQAILDAIIDMAVSLPEHISLYISIARKPRLLMAAAPNHWDFADAEIVCRSPYPRPIKMP